MRRRGPARGCKRTLVRYMQRMAERGLDEAQIRDFRNGWAVRTVDGEMYTIMLAIFEQDGYLTWRW